VSHFTQVRLLTVRYSALLLNFSGRQESVETILAALKVVAEPFRSMSTTLVDACAYAGMYKFSTGYKTVVFRIGRLSPAEL